MKDDKETSASGAARWFTQTVAALSDASGMEGLFHRHREGDPLPSGAVVAEIIALARALLFPGYYGESTVYGETLPYRIGVNAERMYHLLTGQVEAALCFTPGACDCREPALRREQAAAVARRVVAALPALRRLLADDVEAAFRGDPAAESYGEVISCYPAIKALTCYRLAHELQLAGVPLLPRVITEMAHGETGIDIHPAASIGRHFTIDHGTGVVIGATCVIGNRVKLYQGVTLGARSFPLDAEGRPVKGLPRHPILEDDVVVYSNATILGRVTIGRGAVVGGNVWLTHDVPAGQTVKQKQADGFASGATNNTPNNL